MSVLLEVRGLGIVRLPFKFDIELKLVIALTDPLVTTTL